MAEHIVSVEDVTLGYGRHVLHSGLSLSIRRGDFWGIVGPNGSGKTTLLRAILGTQPPLRGAVRRERAITFGYVPQRGTLDEGYPLTVAEIVMMGRFHRIGLLRPPGKADREAVARALEEVGVTGLADRLYRDLSGGQKQRCLIARALVGNPDILVLDEPTTGVDLASQQAILDLILEMHRSRHLTVLLVSHDLSEVAAVARSVVLMDPRFVQAGPTDQIISTTNLSRMYGIPVDVERVKGRLVILPLEETRAEAPTDA